MTEDRSAQRTLRPRGWRCRPPMAGAALVLICLNASAFGQTTAPAPLPDRYGPERQPDRVITLPGLPDPALESTFSNRIAGETRPVALVNRPRLLWASEHTRANVWATLVWFWPDAALLVLLAGLGVSVRRLVWSWRRPPGEGEFCRRCHYSLQGTPGDTCPECGANVRGGNRVLGRGRRRLWPSAGASGLTLALLGVLGYFWYPPRPGGAPWSWWGRTDTGQPGPLRYGRVSGWFHWPSNWLAEWSWAHDFAAGEADVRLYLQVLSFNTATGQAERLVADLPARVDPIDGSPLRPYPYFYRLGEHVLLCVGSRDLYRYDPVGQRLVYLHAIRGDETPLGGGLEQGLNATHDGTLIYDRLQQPEVLVWDTRTWELCGRRSLQHPGDTDPEAHRWRTVTPVQGGSRAIVHWVEGEAPDIKLRSHLWDPRTGEFRPLAGYLGSDPWNLYVLSPDGRFLVEDPRWGSGLGAYDLASNAEEPARFAEVAGLETVQGPGHLVALARTGSMAYVQVDAPGQGVFAWDLAAKRVTPAVLPAESELVRVRTAQEMGTMRESGVSHTGIYRTIRTWPDLPDTAGERIPFPVEALPQARTSWSSEDPPEPEVILSPDGRYTAALLPARRLVLVWDRQRRGWLGRFTAPAGALAPRPQPVRHSVGLFGAGGGGESKVCPIDMDLTNDKLLIYDLSFERVLVYDLEGLAPEVQGSPAPGSRGAPASPG